MVCPPMSEGENPSLIQPVSDAAAPAPQSRKLVFARRATSAVALWSVGQIEQEIRAALRVFDTGDLPQLQHYRPPYGFKSVSVQRAAEHMGLRLVTWSVNPRDYANIDAVRLTRRILDRVRPGSIGLLHDARRSTVEALPELLRRLRGRGYRCVRL